MWLRTPMRHIKIIASDGAGLSRPNCSLNCEPTLLGPITDSTWLTSLVTKSQFIELQNQQVHYSFPPRPPLRLQFSCAELMIRVQKVFSNKKPGLLCVTQFNCIFCSHSSPSSRATCKNYCLVTERLVPSKKRFKFRPGSLPRQGI